MGKPDEHHVFLLPKHGNGARGILSRTPVHEAIKDRLDVLGFIIQKADDDFETADLAQNVEKLTNRSWQWRSSIPDPSGQCRVVFLVIEDVVKERVYQWLC
jgi:hypothetical protein